MGQNSFNWGLYQRGKFFKVVFILAKVIFSSPIELYIFVVAENADTLNYQISGTPRYRLINSSFIPPVHTLQIMYTIESHLKVYKGMYYIFLIVLRYIMYTYLRMFKNCNNIKKHKNVNLYTIKKQSNKYVWVECIFCNILRRINVCIHHISDQSLWLSIDKPCATPVNSDLFNSKLKENTTQ